MRYPVIIILMLGLSCHSPEKYVLPAEWEPHEAMMVSFNNDDLKADSVSVEIVRAISPVMKVYCVIMYDSMRSFYTSWFESVGIPLDSVRFMNYGSSFSYSIRDPLFMLRKNNGDLALADFAWNDYGYLPADTSKRKAFLEASAKDRAGYQNNFISLFNFPLRTSAMVHEGGAIESNGKGTIIQVESTNRQRNPSMSLAQQEAELKRVLGASNIIWLKEGVADDPDGKTLITENYFGIGVKGHVDEFCRFVNPSTILLAFPDSVSAQKDPVTKLTFERMKVNYEILEKSLDQDGKPFQIIKTPVPEFNPILQRLDTGSADPALRRFSKSVLKKYPSFTNGDTTYFVPACSYLNFLVTNDLVLISKYWKPGMPEIFRQKDEQIRSLFASVFPGKKIFQIDPMGLNMNGGGIHCWTQQILARKKPE